MAFLDFELPLGLVAQHPAEPRDACGLLVVDRARSAIHHSRFRELPRLLRPGDLLVLNDTRVLPARLLGHRARTGGKWEGLFLSGRPFGHWELACQMGGKPVPGEIIQVDPGPLQLEFIEHSGQNWLMRPSLPGTPTELLQQFGRTPLPPYIRKGAAEAEDAEQYQTIYAREPGAVAAPTAGLHFTPELFENLQRVGVNWTYLTLHVGAGTFQPIRDDDFRNH